MSLFVIGYNWLWTSYLVITGHGHGTFVLAGYNCYIISTYLGTYLTDIQLSRYDVHQK
jgi:hypothetical protein